MLYVQRPVWKVNMTESNLFVLVINLNPLCRIQQQMEAMLERGLRAVIRTCHYKTMI